MLPITTVRKAKEQPETRAGLSPTATLMLASQLLIVIVLGIMVFTIAYVSWNARDTAHYYYPLMVEGANHTLEMLRHGHQSSASLEAVMAQSEAMAVQSIPEMIDSVNKTHEMVARMQAVSQNPVLKLSMA